MDGSNPCSTLVLRFVADSTVVNPQLGLIWFISDPRKRHLRFSNCSVIVRTVNARCFHHILIRLVPTLFSLLELNISLRLCYFWS